MLTRQVILRNKLPFIFNIWVLARVVNLSVIGIAILVLYECERVRRNLYIKLVVYYFEGEKTIILKGRKLEIYFIN